MRSRVRGLRWWWLAGLVWLGGYFAVAASLWRITDFRRWVWGRTGALLVVLVPPLVGLAWLIVVAPLLQSGVADFTDRRPAARRARVSVALAWTPTAIFSLLVLQFAIVRLLGIDDFGWYDGGYGIWAGTALVLSVVYGRLMARTLVRKTRSAAERAGRCFGCNYDVSESSETCPECGTRRP